MRFEPITAELAEAEDLGVDRGALIRFVETGSPAEVAGVLAGDIVQQVNGEAVDEGHSLHDLIQQYDAGDEVSLTVLRDGETMELPVTLGENSVVPDMEFISPEGQMPPGFHFEFRCSPEPCPFRPFPPGGSGEPAF